MPSLLDILAPNFQPKQNLVLAEPGSPNFFGKHPRLSAGLETAAVAAMNTPSSQTVGEGISSVARAFLGAPQWREQMKLDRMLTPFAAMQPMFQMQKLQQDLQLNEARIRNEDAQTNLYNAQTNAANVKPQRVSLKLSSQQANQIGLPQLADQLVPLDDVKSFFKGSDASTDVVHVDGRVKLINKSNGNVIRDLGKVSYKPDSSAGPRPPAQTAFRAAEVRKQRALEEAERLFRDPKPGFDGMPNYVFNNQAELLRRKQAAQDAYEEEVSSLTGEVVPHFSYDPIADSFNPSQPTPKVEISPDGRVIIR